MKQYVVDAFTDRVFAGNPAAVLLLDAWLPERLMQQIAIENNLSETAFLVKEQGLYHIRWFTPGGEVDLCGHATLASAYVITRFAEPEAKELHFISQSGPLQVRVKGDLLELDFPSRMPEEIPFTPAMQEALKGLRGGAYISRDLMLVLEKEEEVCDFEPDSRLIESLPGMGLILTAPSQSYDFVSRAFFPKDKIPEDPVCGSAHCNLIPYWAKKLGKEKLIAYQASPRGGILYCENRGDRVLIAGRAALYSIAELFLP
ncbi:MAG: PhzF family phenazine biosynthesis protein [Lachnospiraceae bacterium]|nr:PhzF family phenazine biosynthesis protein [Lachnospiraceae bacterium]